MKKAEKNVFVHTRLRTKEVLILLNEEIKKEPASPQRCMVRRMPKTTGCNTENSH